MKLLTGFGLAVLMMCNIGTTTAHAEKGFILLASTIGPIDAGIVEGDESLLNRISLIPVNSKKFPQVNHEDAIAFANWLTDPAKGQKMVSEFGKERFGSPLFFPDSRAWRAQRGK